MQKKRRKFKRDLGERTYRKKFVVAAEGTKTEPQYFLIFNTLKTMVSVKFLRDRHKNAPPQVLKRMDDYLKKEGIKKTDEAWLVVDKDKWTDEQLSQLHKWAQQSDNYGFALSNPKFEYWLLLHFTEGNSITSARDCSERLEREIPGYDKGINARKITIDMVKDAIRRAKKRDSPPCTDWPRSMGCTTVYKLVENILRV